MQSRKKLLIFRRNNSFLRKHYEDIGNGGEDLARHRRNELTAAAAIGSSAGGAGAGVVRGHERAFSVDSECAGMRLWRRASFHRSRLLVSLVRLDRSPFDPEAAALEPCRICGQSARRLLPPERRRAPSPVRVGNEPTGRPALGGGEVESHDRRSSQPLPPQKREAPRPAQEGVAVPAASPEGALVLAQVKGLAGGAGDGRGGAHGGREVEAGVGQQRRVFRGRLRRAGPLDGRLRQAAGGRHPFDGQRDEEGSQNVAQIGLQALERNHSPLEAQGPTAPGGELQGRGSEGAWRREGGN